MYVYICIYIHIYNCRYRYKLLIYGCRYRPQLQLQLQPVQCLWLLYSGSCVNCIFCPAPCLRPLARLLALLCIAFVRYFFISFFFCFYLALHFGRPHCWTFNCGHGRAEPPCDEEGAKSAKAAQYSTVGPSAYISIMIMSLWTREHKSNLSSSKKLSGSNPSNSNNNNATHTHTHTLSRTESIAHALAHRRKAAIKTDPRCCRRTVVASHCSAVQNLQMSKICILPYLAPLCTA